MFYSLMKWKKLKNTMAINNNVFKLTNKMESTF